MSIRFDPFYLPHVAHRDNDDTTRCLRESVAAMRDAEPQPTSGPEPAVDGDTKFRGGKSRRAVRAEWRPVTFGPYDEHGVDKHGHYDPAADGRW